jgi:hypothetical protein
VSVSAFTHATRSTTSLQPSAARVPSPNQPQNAARMTPLGVLVMHAEDSQKIGREAKGRGGSERGKFESLAAVGAPHAPHSVQWPQLSPRSTGRKPFALERFDSGDITRGEKSEMVFGEDGVDNVVMVNAEDPDRVTIRYVAIILPFSKL